jgi:hypothetical protein
VNGKERGVANEIAIGKNVKQGQNKFIYVTHPIKYKGYEIYYDKEGYSPLFVLRDRRGRILYGAYAPIQSIMQEDGSHIYTSGSAVAPGAFPFPQDSEIQPLFNLQTAYYPDKDIKRAGEILFQGWPYDPSPWAEQKEGEEIFKGKAALGKKIRAGDYFLSMDEVRYWTGMKVVYRPGMMIVFSSFWIGLGGLIISAIQKMAMERKRQ